MIVVFDIDGVLADARHRLHFIEGEEQDWDGFFNAMVHDEPIRWGIDLAADLVTAGHELHLLTGRPDSHRAHTEQWLSHHTVLPYEGLMMREAGDHRQDYEVKLENLQEHDLSPETVLLIVDDRTQVVDALREAGFNVLQTAKGDF